MMGLYVFRGRKVDEENLVDHTDFVVSLMGVRLHRIEGLPRCALSQIPRQWEGQKRNHNLCCNHVP